MSKSTKNQDCNLCRLRPLILSISLFQLSSVSRYLKTHVPLTVKSVMLTANVEYIPKALFMALSHAQDNLLPDNVALCANSTPCEGTFTKAQMSIASHETGTTTAFATKSHRIR